MQIDPFWDNFRAGFASGVFCTIAALVAYLVIAKLLK